MTTRRGFLAGAGAVAVGPAVLSRSTAAQTQTTLEEETPEHVTRSYDEALLQRYKPYLITRDLGSNTPTALYGFVARSSEEDTAVLVYWAKYPFQQGVAGGWDSHFGDHEPIYVRVNESTGKILDVSPSVYHWLAGYYPDPPVVEDDSGIHPNLYVVHPYHHYSAWPADDSGVDVDLANLSDETLQSWLDNGWDEAIYLRSLTYPWVMTGENGRTDWWTDNVGTFSFEAFLRRTYLRVGIYTGGTVDTDALRKG